jgi:hypothetical protein
MVCPVNSARNEKNGYVPWGSSDFAAERYTGQPGVLTLGQVVGKGALKVAPDVGHGGSNTRVCQTDDLGRHFQGECPGRLTQG